MKLDLATTTVLLEYIQSQNFDEQSRTIGAVILKNIVKKAYGVSLNNHLTFLITPL